MKAKEVLFEDDNVLVFFLLVFSSNKKVFYFYNMTGLKELCHGEIQPN